MRQLSLLVVVGVILVAAALAVDVRGTTKFDPLHATWDPEAEAAVSSSPDTSSPTAGDTPTATAKPKPKPKVTPKPKPTMSPEAKKKLEEKRASRKICSSTPRTIDKPGLIETTVNNTKKILPKNPTGFLTAIGPYPVLDLSAKTKGTTFKNMTGRTNKFLLHTTEGNWPYDGTFESARTTLDSKKYWVHFLIGRNKTGHLVIGQFMPLHKAPRGLEKYNDRGAIQVEIGAKADFPFTEWDCDLREAVKAMWVELYTLSNGGIKLEISSKVKFGPGSTHYGAKAKSRLNITDYEATAGLVGHQHVPANKHYDPGAIDPNVLLPAFAKQ